MYSRTPSISYRCSLSSKSCDAVDSDKIANINSGTGSSGRGWAVLRYARWIQIFLGWHHNQIRLHRVRGLALRCTQLQFHGDFLDKTINAPGCNAVPHPVPGGFAHADFDGMCPFIQGVVHAICVKFAPMHTFGAVVGIGGPIQFVFVGNVVGVAGIVVTQAFNVRLPFREMRTSPGNPFRAGPRASIYGSAPGGKSRPRPLATACNRSRFRTAVVMS